MKSMALALIEETITVNPGTYTVPAVSVRARDELVASAQDINVTTALDNEAAGRVVVRIRGAIKDAEAARKERSKPLDIAKAKLIEIERDWFAGMALQQICRNGDTEEDTARACYKLADTMIAERDRSK